jgi:tungstate transport system permease protein
MIASGGQPWTLAYVGNIYAGEVKRGIGRAWQLVIHGDPVLLQTTGNTLHLGFNATLFATVLGVPLGCVLGLGRFRGRRPLLAVANALTRVPPVVVGVFLTAMFWPRSEWGGGPLTDVNVNYFFPVEPFLAQGLLALPIMIALTATAVQRVPQVLLEQARVYGASRWQRALLALREARTAVLAAMIVSMGITMTAIGALLTFGGGYSSGPVQSAGFAVDGQVADPTLALGVITDYNQTAQPPFGVDLLPVAMAFTVAMLGLFLLTAGALTFLQQSRTSWIAGGQS